MINWRKLGAASRGAFCAGVASCIFYFFGLRRVREVINDPLARVRPLAPR